MIEGLRTEIEALVSAEGAHLIELESRTQGRKLHLDIYVDTEEGITADELAKLSRKLGEQLDERNVIEDSYTLVVSSPGLDRPLRFPWQYHRHAGRTIQVSFRSGGDVQRLEGTITEVSEDQIIVSEGEGMRAIPYEDIERAQIIATL